MNSRIRIKNMRTAIDVYVNCPDIGTKEIQQLFDCSPSTARRLKQAVIEEQKSRGMALYSDGIVHTRLAFEVWHIDIKDILKRYREGQKLMREVRT